MFARPFFETMRGEMKPRFFLGIDAGGTKTHAAIADHAGRIVGFGRAGSANWESNGLDATRAALAAAVDGALRAARLRRTDVCAVGCGITSFDWPEDEARLRPLLEALGIAAPIAMVNDAEIALFAGATDGIGVVVIAGTGTVCAGRNHRSESARTLGLGTGWGDFGGAWDIVGAATCAMMHAHYGRGPATLLTARIPTACGFGDVLAFAQRATREGIEALDGVLAPVVFATAAEGDEIARAILVHAGEELGENAVALARRLDFRDENFGVVLAGGLFRAEFPRLRETLAQRVRAYFPHAQIVTLQAPPVIGGVLLAMQTVGEKPSADMRRQLAQDALSAVSENT